MLPCAATWASPQRKSWTYRITRQVLYSTTARKSRWSTPTESRSLSWMSARNSLLKFENNSPRTRLSSSPPRLPGRTVPANSIEHCESTRSNYGSAVKINDSSNHKTYDKLRGNDDLRLARYARHKVRVLSSGNIEIGVLSTRSASKPMGSPSGCNPNAKKGRDTRVSGPAFSMPFMGIRIQDRII